eukprot:GILJ01007643.1.p1 GENE.GILJ01007643.1~~GILJ01007643.1.p1  ORF type:complete len:326 (+),score=50.86 GILJ01007643.1:45-1022(+)
MLDKALRPLHPFFFAHVRLAIVDILNLNEDSESPGDFFFHNHPVTRVETQGVVVNVKQRQQFLQYIIDDGTGLIPCMCWLEADAAQSATEPAILELGALVNVRGKLSTYRQERQIVVSTIRVEEDPNMESWWWLETIQLRQEVYLAPVSKFVSTFEQAAAPSNKQTKVDYESSFQAQLLRVIDAMEVTAFPYSHIRQHSELVASAVELVRKHSTVDRSSEVEESLVSSLFARCMRRLVAEGHVFMLDVQQDTYGVVNVATLQPIILEMLGSSAASGVQQESILDKLKMEPKFRSSSRTKIISVLDALVEASVIFEVEPKRFAVLR